MMKSTFTITCFTSIPDEIISSFNFLIMLDHFCFTRERAFWSWCTKSSWRGPKVDPIWMVRSSVGSYWKPLARRRLWYRQQITTWKEQHCVDGNHKKWVPQIIDQLFNIFFNVENETFKEELKKRECQCKYLLYKSIKRKTLLYVT